MGMVKILCLIIIACASAILYNWGGRGAPFNTKVRDWGCPIAVINALVLMGHNHWSLAITFFTLWAALTTYWKKKGTDAKWYNWLATGAGYGFALLPFSWITGCLFGWLCYTLNVAVLTCILSQSINNVVWEERARGFVLVMCLPLLYVRC